MKLTIYIQFFVMKQCRTIETWFGIIFHACSCLTFHNPIPNSNITKPILPAWHVPHKRSSLPSGQ